MTSTEQNGSLESMLSQLHLVLAGKSAQRLDPVPSTDPTISQVIDAMNRILQRYDQLAKRMDSMNRSNIAGNLELTECVKALREVQQGNLHARAGDFVTNSDNKVIASLGDALNRALESIQEQMSTIRSQQLTIEELSTPILEVWDDILVLPIIGVVDSRRAVEIMERLLSEIVHKGAEYVILDITGVEVVDTKTGDHFIKLLKAAEMLGTVCVLTGIRPAVAQTLVDIGMDLTAISTLRNLRAGLRECLKRKRSGRSRTQRQTRIDDGDGLGELQDD
jgi:anti-anti-sigma regulatory factor